jgi:transposase
MAKSALIGELYTVKRLVQGRFPATLRPKRCGSQLRQERSRPILDRIWQWATVQVGLSRNDFGKAVRYMLERWAGLTRFVDDPRIPLDNNAAERALRGPWSVARITTARARSAGTEVAAVFYTLCETARLIGVDPHAYLLRAVYAAIDQPGTVTVPDDLLPTSPTT